MPKTQIAPNTIPEMEFSSNQCNVYTPEDELVKIAKCYENGRRFGKFHKHSDCAAFACLIDILPQKLLRLLSMVLPGIRQLTFLVYPKLPGAGISMSKYQIIKTTFWSLLGLSLRSCAATSYGPETDVLETIRPRLDAGTAIPTV